MTIQSELITGGVRSLYAPFPLPIYEERDQMSTLELPTPASLGMRF
jgi:hypothetical protein